MAGFINHFGFVNNIIVLISNNIEKLESMASEL